MPASKLWQLDVFEQMHTNIFLGTKPQTLSLGCTLPLPSLPPKACSRIEPRYGTRLPTVSSQWTQWLQLGGHYREVGPLCQWLLQLSVHVYECMCYLHRYWYGLIWYHHVSSHVYMYSRAIPCVGSTWCTVINSSHAWNNTVALGLRSPITHVPTMIQPHFTSLLSVPHSLLQSQIVKLMQCSVVSLSNFKISITDTVELLNISQ